LSSSTFMRMLIYVMLIYVMATAF